MADTCRGSFPDKFCSGCGLENTNFRYWGPAIPNGSRGYNEAYFDNWCFNIWTDFYGRSGQTIPLPLIYDHSTGKPSHPKISFSELGKDNNVNQEYSDFEMSLESTPGECNCKTNMGEAGAPCKPSCLSQYVVVGHHYNDQILHRILPIDQVDFSQPKG